MAFAPKRVAARHRGEAVLEHQRSRSGHLRTDEVHALAFSPIEKMSDVLIIPSIMLRRGQKWNGGYKLIVRLGATANKKEKSCPRFLIVEFFGVRGAMHAARSDDEGTFPILGARAHRDRKQGSEQVLISLLVQTALEPATRPL